MQPEYQKRVIEERESLNEKLIKLQKFINSEEFANLNNYDRNLLQEQKMAMIGYLDILNLRIGRF